LLLIKHLERMITFHALTLQRNEHHNGQHDVTQNNDTQYNDIPHMTELQYSEIAFRDIQSDPYLLLL